MSCYYGKFWGHLEIQAKFFLYLELGILPARYVIMKKRLNFLRYILKEDMGSMIQQVYEALKTESRNGDFVNLVKKDIYRTQQI